MEHRKDSLREREEKRNLAKEQGEKYIEDTSDPYCSKKYITNIDDVTRELLIWAVLSGRDDKIKQIIAEEKRPLKVNISTSLSFRIVDISIFRIFGLSTKISAFHRCCSHVSQMCSIMQRIWFEWQKG